MVTVQFWAPSPPPLPGINPGATGCGSQSVETHLDGTQNLPFTGTSLLHCGLPVPLNLFNVSN